MHKPEPVLENGSHKILSDFEMGRSVQVRRVDFIVINNKKVDFAVPADYILKITENETHEKYLDIGWELKGCRF